MRYLRSFQICCFALVITLQTFAQPAPDLTPKVVAEFENSRQQGKLYIRNESDVAPQDDRTGNDLVFDENGTPIIYQYEQRKIYFLDPRDFLVTRIIDIRFPDYYIEHLVIAQNGVLFFHHILGKVKATKYDGTLLFEVGFGRPQITSFYYHSDILFLTDADGKLSSVIHPSLDQNKNKQNYLDVDQTSNLFSSGSKIDLGGLSRDGKGNVYLNRLFVSNGTRFYPTVNSLMYIQGRNRFWVSSESADLATIKTGPIDGEILESIAVHPSGDIYFLRYSLAKNKHVLYKIENNWDVEAKKAWGARKS